MKYFLIFFLFIFSAQSNFAQNNILWKGYFSYNEIKDISQSDTNFYAASENAIFSKNIATGILKTINTIDGLASQKISSAYHSPAFNKTLVGYENGLMVIINENDGSILNVVDIINKQIPPNIKKINHFNEYEGIVYISCDFGIVQYNLATLQFGDTYFIGNTTAEIIVTQTCIFNGYIYAATLAEGIKKAELTNPNLIDATQWTQALPGSFIGVTAFNGSIFTLSQSGQMMRSVTGNGFSPFGSVLTATALDMRANSNNLIVTSSNTVYIYNQQLGLESQINNFQITEASVVFTCATTINNIAYIGTAQHGVITSTINTADFEFISPSGPVKNNIFSINTSSGNLFAVYGGYSDNFNPDPLRYYGFSKYHPDSGWLNIPFSEMDGAPNLVRVTLNPANESQIFISSYHSGLLKFENEELVNHYTHANSGLESVSDPTAPNYISVRIEQSAFDKSGNLWMTNGLIKNPLKVLKTDGQWNSYKMDDILDNYFDARLGRLVIDKNGTKWISTLTDGLIGFNETLSQPFKKINVEEGNLPSVAVQVAAIDKRNQIWIGTRNGLRVLSSVDRFMGEEALTTNEIIIIDEGVVKPLMHEQWITDIVVDGANNKWIGTLDAGVFLFSSDGQETLHHFTSANSPLPSNDINDIDIDSKTGEVFFATANGMVSYKGNAIDPSDNLKNVIVYPNPVRPGFAGTVKISGLLDKANIKITDIEGNLVYETISEGGTIEWDTRAFGKYKVASGVYMIFISGQDGMETKVKKVMIIR